MAGAMAPAAVMAKSENLGDLKLYRIPVPVTVAARSQKQVAFLQKERVTGTLLYRSRIDYVDAQPPQMLFRFRNRKADGLGDPLPAGKAVVYQDSELGRMVVGEASLPDKAVDEEVEVTFGEPANVTLEAVTLRIGNARPARAHRDHPQRQSLRHPLRNRLPERHRPAVHRPAGQAHAQTRQARLGSDDSGWRCPAIDLPHRAGSGSSPYSRRGGPARMAKFTAEQAADVAAIQQVINEWGDELDSTTACRCSPPMC